MTRSAIGLAVLLGACSSEPPCDPGFLRVEEACVLRSVRLVAPLSTSITATRRPTLHWAFAGDPAEGVRVEVCRDRPCADLIVAFDAEGTSAAPPMDLPAGTVFWRAFERRGGVAGSIPSHTWSLRVRALPTPVDRAWGSTLDLNGDGYGDLAVGALGAGGDEHDSGRAYVYLGGAEGIGSRPATVLRAPGSEESQYRFFGYVADGGDLDGDGFSDLAVATTGWVSHVHVWRGGADGIRTSRPHVSLSGDLIPRPVGVGDLDGDGYADLLVASEAGIAHVHRGGPSGPDAAPVAVARPPDSDADVLVFARTAIGVGDVDGDGRADVVIGSDTRDSGGRVDLYHGTPGGLEPGAQTWRGREGATFGEGTTYFGRSLGAGDVDGDGLTDLIVGNVVSPGTMRRVHVFRGNGAGFDAVESWGLDEVRSAERLAVADVSGDDIDDVIVFWSGGAGEVTVHLGGPSGLSSVPSTSIIDPQFSEGAGYSGFGSDIATADLDGDHRADLVVGASNGGLRHEQGPGLAYVFLGDESGVLRPAMVLEGPDGGHGLFGSTLAP